ncbi:TIR domain-containing protein [Amycolatopsis sp. Hca4]|uniref:TIR domain-containing protein n=1 Tax=Amycolatopsis sp. Hca4 TaxID=2742131 RepID=UPI00159176FB|nr:TIR domain-containing protein [Amycolatopsis sp. Hca4]QKV75681.1 TIR domain-containing protein [Amycolatopsis sp. Hca4]
MTQPMRRRNVIARAVLHWLYVENDAYPVAEDFLELPESRIDGEQVGRDEFARIIRWLDDRGLVDGVRVDEQDYPVRIILTPRGRLVVVEQDGWVQPEAAPAKPHVSTVAEAFLGWLYQHDHEQPPPKRFLDDQLSEIEGHQVSEADLVEAVELLLAQQLVDGPGSWGSRIPLRIRLTSAGRARAAELDGPAKSPAPADEDQPRPPVVFISYAWDSDDRSHNDSVRRLWELLRLCGIDAQLDLDAEQQRQDWPLWMGKQIREADHVLVIASPAYRERAEGRGEANRGRGVQWEARLIRDAFYADPNAVNRFIPVVLPGQSEAGVPDFLAPASTTYYTISDFTVEGAEGLLRLLTDQPEVIRPPLGTVPLLPPRPIPQSAPPVREQPPASGVRNVVTGDVSGLVIQAGSIGSVAPTGALPSAGIQVGEGAGLRTKRAFEDAFRRAGGPDRLGRPTDKVFEEGPVSVQHFTGDGESDAVICAIADQAAVVVDGPVWDDLSTLPRFPAQGVPIARTDATARVVDLAGGTWGEGVLFRSTGTQAARWQPKPRLSMEAREAFRLPVAEPADVTIRAIATLPWPLDDDLEITGRTRHHLETLLPLTDFNALAQTLSIRPGDHGTPRRWERASGPNAHQSGRHARYDQTFANPADGSAGVRAVARIMLPGVLSSAITVTVEFQVNFAAWRAALAAVVEGVGAPDLRITAHRIVDLWTAQWDAATRVLPRALVADPETAALLALPAVELQIKLNDEVSDHRGLLDVVDLSVFGEPDGQPGSPGAATMTAPIGLDRAQRRVWAAKALTRMARGWGFVDADESDLRRRSRS